MRQKYSNMHDDMTIVAVERKRGEKAIVEFFEEENVECRNVCLT